MSRFSTISKEAREYVIEQLHEQGEMTKSEVVEMIRPHCSFDPIRLQEKELNVIAARIIRRIRDENGVRTAFILRKEDMVIDVETCRTLAKVQAVEDMLTIQLDGLEMSRSKAQSRRMDLEGQLNMFSGEAQAVRPGA